MSSYKNILQQLSDLETERNSAILILSSNSPGNKRRTSEPGQAAQKKFGLQKNIWK
jgi:hypothetical protein